jgi:hypothetical protein
VENARSIPERSALAVDPKSVTQLDSGTVLSTYSQRSGLSTKRNKSPTRDHAIRVEDRKTIYHNGQLFGNSARRECTAFEETLNESFP